MYLFQYVVSEYPGHAHLDRELYLLTQLQIELTVPELGQVTAVFEDCTKVKQVLVVERPLKKRWIIIYS